MRIERTPYFADILRDARSAAPAWHCIIQAKGSDEILVWRQYPTEEAAHREALAELDELLHRDRQRAGQLHLPMGRKHGSDVA